MNIEMKKINEQQLNAISWPKQQTFCFSSNTVKPEKGTQQDKLHKPHKCIHAKPHTLKISASGFWSKIYLTMKNSKKINKRIRSLRKKMNRSKESTIKTKVGKWRNIWFWHEPVSRFEERKRGSWNVWAKKRKQYLLGFLASKNGEWREQRNKNVCTPS